MQYTSKQRARLAGIQGDRQTGRQTSTQTGRQTDRQTEGSFARNLCMRFRTGGRVLRVQGKERRREGLWRLPERGALEMEGRGLLLKMKYSIMHYRVTLYVYDGAVRERLEGEEFVDVAGVAMASPYRKAVSEKLKC